MGSATRESLSSAKEALAELGAKAQAATGEELLSAARLIAGNAQLQGLLAEGETESSQKKEIVERVFAALGAPSRSLLTAIASGRWSSEDDLVAAVEDLGIRVLASTSTAPLGEELFAFGRIVSSDAELELALSSKLSTGAAKAALVETLLKGKAAAATVTVLGHLVQVPRGRRVRQLVEDAVTIVADAAGQKVATITVAAPLSASQQKAIEASLAAKYGAGLSINQVVDAGLIGGVRIRVGTDVIDGSVASRLNDLRLQLAV